MVFALDNTSNDDKDIQQVRDAVEWLGLQSDDYKIRTPHSWMLFAVTLRHLPGRVLSIEDCMQVANECGIKDRGELDDALWFLHHNVGIVRHFQEVPELRDVVIKEPQYRGNYPFHQDSVWEWLLPKRNVWSTSCQSDQATENLTA